ncbi:hypothetical protein Mapa_001648 [Marchantia paleacea]|nr:hypothetical protein Mapa_001648 [Marchantia paleacea]
MGKCMSKDKLQDTVIQHISSPVRTDDGVGFALGRLSNSHQTRWVKYEDLGPSEEDKPVVSEGQVIISRSSSRSYGLPLPQGHLVSCPAFVSGGGSRRESKECTCGHRRLSDGGRAIPSTAKSPSERKPLAIIQKLSPVIKVTSEPKAISNGPENDVENVGAKPVKLTFNTPTKTRPALRETNVNVNVSVPADVAGPKAMKSRKESRENVDVEDMLPRRASPRRPLRPSLTEKEFQSLDSPPVRTPTKQPLERTEEMMKSPVSADKCPAPISSPKNASTNSLGSSLQSILSAISDPESTSLVEEVLSKASAAQSRCTDLESKDMAESKASHSPLDDDSDTESNDGITDADTPSSKAPSSDSTYPLEDDGPGNTPITARSVRTRLPMHGEFCKEDKPLHWKASALYTNCLFEESPAKNPVKTSDKKSPMGVTKFTLAPEAEIDLANRFEKSLSSVSLDTEREGSQSDSADVGPELKRKSVDETLSPRECPSPFKKVKSLTEKTLPTDLQLPTPGSAISDGELNSSAAEREAVTPDNEIAPDVKAFLETSKKVVLSFGPDSIGDCNSDSKSPPCFVDSQTTYGFKELFSSNSFAGVFELETLLVTSDVRRMSGHGVEGLQIVGSELTELFSSNVRPSEGIPVEANPVAQFSKSESKHGDLTVHTRSSLPKSEASPVVTSPRSLSSLGPSVRDGAKVAPSEVWEESNGGERFGTVTQDPCQSETFELESLDFDSPCSKKKSTPQVSPAQAAEDVLKPVRTKADVAPGHSGRKSSVTLSFPTTTSAKRTALSCSTKPFRDPDSYREAAALSLEDFQFLLDAAEKEEEKRVAAGASPANWSGNTLASFGRSLLQKLRDSLPTTPTSSLPSTPKISAHTTPLISSASTPKRTGPHANSVALSPEEIAEIWGAFEQSHLM